MNAEDKSMKRIIATTAVAVSLAVGLFAGGTWWGHRSGAAPVAPARGNRLQLPDAPRLPQRPSRRLPHLRHAPRGGSRDRHRGRRRRLSRFPGRRGACECRAAASDRRSARRRQPRGPHQPAADDRARGVRREPDLSHCRRRERLDSQSGERHDGRRREGAPGARVLRTAPTRVR